MSRLVINTEPLHDPIFRDLWLGLSISNIGTQFTVVAVGLQVYAITGSTPAVGLLALFALVPLMVFGLYGGAVVDRFDRRVVAIVSGFVGWLAVVGLVLHGAMGHESVWVLDGLVAVQSGAMAVSSPARSALMPRLIPPNQMAAANALMSLSWNIALTVGPFAGALVVANWGFAVAYGVDAVLFAGALFALVRLPPVPPQGDGSRSGSVATGLRFLGTAPNLRMTFIVDIIAMATALPRVVFPAVGVWYLGGGEATTGALTAAIAVGGVIAGVMSGALTAVKAQGKAITWAITVWGTAVALFGVILAVAGRTRPDHVVVGGLIAAFVVLAVAGAADSISAIYRVTILQIAAPDELRGRIQGVFTVVVVGGPRLGDLSVGSLAGWFTEPVAVVVGGLVCVTALWAVVRSEKQFWRYDASVPKP